MLDKWVVSGPIPSPYCYTYTAVCHQAKTVFLQIAGGKGVETTMALGLTW